MTELHESTGTYALNALEPAELTEFEAHLRDLRNLLRRGRRLLRDRRRALPAQRRHPAAHAAQRRPRRHPHRTPADRY